MEVNEVIDKTKYILNGHKAELFDEVSEVFPMATECIKGYYNQFDLKDKDILTVCSSGDHIFSALANDIKSVDTFDVNALTEYYFYLKKAAIEQSNFNEFKSYFIDKLLVTGKLNLSEYEKIREGLEGKYQIFWDEIIQYSLNNKLNLLRLFIAPALKSKYHYKYLSYFDNEKYEILQGKLKNFKMKFFHTNLTNLHLQLNNTYDYIFLSNINSYLNTFKVKEIAQNNLMPFMNDNGEIVYGYLYDTSEKRAKVYQSNIKTVDGTKKIGIDSDLVLTLKK